MKKFKDIAIRTAKKAGEIHKKYFRKDIRVRRKTKSYDLVTIVDVESEKAIVSLIKKYFPDHNILAEENIYKKTSSEYTWVIDPLDGTNNFSHGLPIFCVSIALAKNNDVILGVVYDPIKDELFYAEKNKGAYLNGIPIKVSSVDKLNRALLVTGFYYDRGKEMIEALEAIKRFFYQKIIGLRRFGAAALDLCYVACGRVTGFWEFKLSPWDFAAGKLIVEEAGGKVTNKYGKKLELKNSFIVASNSRIHRKMLKIITAVNLRG
ncbi:MAG: inositol monophosphatase family protein [Candidatus Omnitrophota bacterium]